MHTLQSCTDGIFVYHVCCMWAPASGAVCGKQRYDSISRLIRAFLSDAGAVVSATYLNDYNFCGCRDCDGTAPQVFEQAMARFSQHLPLKAWAFYLFIYLYIYIYIYIHICTSCTYAVLKSNYVLAWIAWDFRRRWSRRHAQVCYHVVSLWWHSGAAMFQ